MHETWARIFDGEVLEWWVGYEDVSYSLIEQQIELVVGAFEFIDACGELQAYGPGGFVGFHMWPEAG
jgi:hypothetical protein